MRPTFSFNKYPSPSWNKQIFQMYPSRGHITIQDARDVYELCSTIVDPKAKDAVYQMHGMDGEAVEKYLHVVERLYLCYHMPSYKQHKQTMYKEIPTVSWIDLVKAWISNWTYHQLRRKHLS